MRVSARCAGASAIFCGVGVPAAAGAGGDVGWGAAGVATPPAATAFGSSPSAAISEIGSFTGTSAGPFFGQVRPGTHVKMIGAAEYTFGDEGIVSVRHVFDFSGVLVATGVLKVKPAT